MGTGSVLLIAVLWRLALCPHSGVIGWRMSHACALHSLRADPTNAFFLRELQEDGVLSGAPGLGLFSLWPLD